MSVAGRGARMRENAMGVRRGAAALAVVGLVAALLVACGRDKHDTARQPTADSPVRTPSTSSTARPDTPSPTATASPEQAVLEAYRRFWEAYAVAVLNLDPTQIEGVAAADRLQGIQEEIEDLRRRGLAIRVNVTHNPMVVEVRGDRAVVYDEMVNNSFYVNAQTKEPRVASGSGIMLKDTYYLQRMEDGSWKVIDGGRQQ
jgi:hypothetical protein